MSEDSDQDLGATESTFQQLSLPAIINTGTDDFVEEFYKPLLEAAVTYKRGVGYFTTGWLAANAQGMAAFAQNGGSAQWITSPQLSEEDWEALQAGNKARRDEILRDHLQEQVQDLATQLENDTRNALAWLIADGALEIRFAIPSGDLQGEFHDKWGIFTAESNDRVAFHGSQNDSAKGFQNYESYDVFCDWEGKREASRVSNHEQRFDALWKNNVAEVETLSLPDSIQQDIVDLRETTEAPYTKPETGITLREYQQTAVDAWKANNRRGMLEMATGTGKTYTAIGAMEELLQEHSDPVAVIISVPFTHLANQWAESLAEWGYENPKFVYGSANPDWKEDISRILSDMSIGVREDAIFLTTHTTLASDFFIEQFNQTGVRTLLIADEVHGVGSEYRREALLDSYEYRLGLSATPTRYYDEQGTRALETFFDGIVFEYTLADAIPEYLTEYRYYPHIVEMTDEELSEYSGISKQLASEMGRDNPDQERVERLFLKRAGIIKSAERKLETLRSVVSELEQQEESDHLLVYTDHRQIDDAQEILNEEGLIQHRFTNEEDDDERASLLGGFAEGRYDALVAMKCLDEGVDVPSTRRAILMSNSQNPKQFIQRRGRVLRRHDESGKEMAEIHDLIVVPTLDPDRELIESEKNILKRELERFEEFADTAQNQVQAKNSIQSLRTEYEL